MKQVLVLGATGAMGRYLVPALAQNGYCVDAISLDDAPAPLEHVKYYKQNAMDDTVLARILQQKKYDAIVDFMLYAEAEFYKRHELLLQNTRHYIFLSSYRVYADLECPIKESSPRLLEVSEDSEFLGYVDTEYALFKAREEDILRRSPYINWTILRPSMVYSTYRYQLVGLEAPTFIARAQKGKPVILPENAMELHAALTWSGDITKMILGLLLNENAYGETYTAASGETITWAEVTEIYKTILHADILTVSREEYAKIFKPFRGEWYKHLYDRFYDRVIDNSKILQVTGLTASDFTGFKTAVSRELERIKDKADWQESAISAKMDEYLEIHKHIKH